MLEGKAAQSRAYPDMGTSTLTHTRRARAQVQTQAHIPSPSGPSTHTYFNDPRNTRQSGELIGRCLAGRGGHQTQECGLGEKEVIALRSLCLAFWERPQGLGACRCRQQEEPLSPSPQ